jgi:CRP/FNR family transcriptional regulator, polysaccharide utilization system transcription regulator
MISPCILVIDNDVKRLFNLESALSRAGYRVLTAYDGRQGVYLAQATRPEAIVCDVTNPSRNEVDVRGTLAQDSQTASIPLIPLTKSFDRHELVARVNAVIRSQPFI